MSNITPMDLYVNYPDKPNSFSCVSSALASLSAVENAPQSYPAAAEEHIAPVTIHIAF